MADANRNSAMRNMMSALNCTLRDYNRAGSAITPEQENRELRFVGGNLMVVAVYNTAVSYHAFINPAARNLAYAIPNYMQVIPLVIQGFTLVTGITAAAIGWLLIVSDNPRQYNRLLKVILLLVLIASSFTMGELL